MKRILLLAILSSPLGLLGCGGNEPRETPLDQLKRTYADKDVMVLIDTSKGPIQAQIYVHKAPKTAANFLKYVDEKFYDGTVFHRVISDFMIQGGGLEPGKKEEKKPLFEPIKNESDNGLKNLRGTLAMARTDVPDSATCQFFISVKDNAFLDRGEDLDKFKHGQDPRPDKTGYAVFGKVTKGMDVVDAIRYVETNARDVPVEDVIIKSIRRML